MNTPNAMPKDQTFKLRLDSLDRDRLGAVAEYYAAPAATAIRMLIAEKYNSLQKPTEDRYAAFMKNWSDQIQAFAERMDQLRKEVTPLFACSVLPIGAIASVSDHDKLSSLMNLSTITRVGYTFPSSQHDKVYNRLGLVEGVEGVAGYEHEWRAHMVGPFGYVEAWRQVEATRSGRQGRYLSFARACAKVGLTFLFAQQYFERRDYSGDVLLEFLFTDTKGRMLLFDNPDFWAPERFECREDQIRVSAKLSTSDLRSGWNAYAATALEQVCALFQASPTQAIETNLRSMMHR